MRYNKMLCLVDQKVKTDLIKLSNGKFQIIFVNNYDDFKKNISNGVYPVIALSIAHKNINNIKYLLQSFSELKFRILVDIDIISSELIDAFSDADKRFRNYTTEQLIENFKVAENQ